VEKKLRLIQAKELKRTRKKNKRGEREAFGVDDFSQQWSMLFSDNKT
jgi:hypothetical protein